MSAVCQRHLAESPTALAVTPKEKALLDIGSLNGKGALKIENYCQKILRGFLQTDSKQSYPRKNKKQGIIRK